ncbi:MAG: hypothetical protein OXT01_29225 [Rhodospirillaceae bacterium]|nr:hypothetical protein [Rhodospirillaceae bacterium]
MSADHQVVDTVAVDIAGGLINLNNSGDFFLTNNNAVINNGNLAIGGGTLSISGDSVFTQNVDLALATAGAHIFVGDDSVVGKGTLNGTGTLTVGANTTLSLEEGGLLDVATDAFGVVESNNNTFNVDSTLIINSGATFNLAGANSLLGTGVFDVRRDTILDGETIGATFNQTSGTATLSGANTTVDGTLTASGTGVISSDFSGTTLGGAGVLDIQNSGTFAGDDITIATINVSGDLELRDDMQVTSSRVDIAAGGTISNFTGGDGGPTFNLGTGTLSNAGTLDVDAFGQIRLGTGTHINQASGLIDGGTNRTVSIFSGTVTNLGTLALGDGILNIASDGILNQDVDITFVSGANINLGNNVEAGTLGGAGTVTLDTGATITFDGGAVLDVDTVSSGLITAATDTITVNSTLTLEAAGDITLSDNVLAGTGVYFSNDSLDFSNGTIATGATYIQNTGTFQTGASGMVNNGLIEFAAGFGGATIGSAPGISGTGTVDNLGTLTLGDSIINQTKFVNQGQLIANGTGSSIGAPTATNLAGGTITVDGVNDELTFSLSGGTLNNSGVINVANSGFFQVANGVLDNNADINVGIGSTFQTSAAGVGLQNDGNFITDSLLTFNFDGGVSTNAGTLVLNNTSTFDFRVSGGKLENSGRIDINNGGEGLNVNATGGDGTLHNLAAGTITVDSSGTISTGAGAVFQDDGTTIFGGSPGSLTINGDYARGGSSFLEMELGGLAAGVHDGFDQLTVNGTMSAGGTMQVTEFGDFEVSVGDSFAVVQADAIEDSFHVIDGLDVGGGVVLDAVQDVDSITLVGKAVTHQGDGGADLMHGGGGDDVFTVSDTGFGRLDGGGGTDLVTFDGAGQSFDLTQLRGDQLSSIEHIDFGGFGDNVLTLDADIAFAAAGETNSLTGAAHSLLIDGDSGDTLNALGEWSNTGTVTIGGEGYTVYQSTNNDAQIFVDDDIAVTAA